MAAKRQWKITRDVSYEEAQKEQAAGDGRALVFAGRDETGTCGPFDYDAANDAGMTERFRMYDDDGGLNYEGIATPGSDFEPLDDFGEPNAGCTRIDYLQPDGTWETL